MTDVSEAVSTPRVARRRESDNGSSAMVTVACNLPNGLLLQLYHVEEVESYLPNGRVIKENDSHLDLGAGQYVLNGAALDLGALAGGGVPDYRVIKGTTPGTGYALTSGIPREFWERWLEQNKGSPLVKGRHVFAASTEARTADEARDYRDLRSGLQGINPTGDYRIPTGRSIRKYSPNDNRTTPEQPELSPEV